MNSYISMSADDRRSYCEEAAEKLRLPAPSIDKDFWVCWTLRELFTLPEWGQHLTFKGGTSLAKAWKLIERFSEDIDLVIGRDFLGFGGENSPDHAGSPDPRVAIRLRLHAAGNVLWRGPVIR